MKASTGKDILSQAKDEVARDREFKDYIDAELKVGQPGWDVAALAEMLEEASLLAMERIAEMSFIAGDNFQYALLLGAESEPDRSTFMNNLFPKI